jgi:NAD(P)-dependent dehydrogenase (short-subunit alcohol dehydrogenase family)
MSGPRWDFAGKTALVSGAAAGIGEEIVRSLAGGGATVVFSDVNEAGGLALERELRSTGARVHFVPSDATNEDQVKALVETAYQIENRLDVAINNVGGSARGDKPAARVHEIELADLRETFDKSLVTTFLGMKHQIPKMLASGGGAIVNVASMAGMRWTDAAGMSYGVAKAGVVKLTQFAAIAYAADRIRVNVVAPGITGTKNVLNAFPDEAARNNWVSRYHPIGRIIEPREIADACLFAASDLSSGVTGLAIPVDGGWAAR